MLTLKDIHKDYEGKPLLCGVSFTVARDETICLLGPSGSGKSTLLRIIAGLEDAKSGQVFWQQTDLMGTPPHKRGFGLMFQDYALFPHKNVAENIAFGLRMQQMPEDEIKKRVRAGLATIDMQAFANRKVTELSGGEQQRVALARALAPQPRLLMLDEPLGALDRTLRAQLSQELRRILRDTAVPAIYVTHDQEEAFAIADRILLLHHGRILQSGTPQEIYHHPKNVWVASFFGLGNLIEGRVVSDAPLRVETALGILHAHCDDPGRKTGQKVTLLLRPKQACRDAAACPNQIRGRAIDQVFQGDSYQISLHCNDDVPDFTVELSKPTQIGADLTVGFETETILCLDEETPAT